MLNMAMVADDDDYAHVVLICSGQFNDPNFEGRLTHITRQLHMLTTGTKEPLVKSVEPWNSVRVTLKVSRESAALLQTLAQQQDPKLLDIGILSVQVEGGSPVSLNRPSDALSKLQSANDRLSADGSVQFAAGSASIGAQPPDAGGVRFPNTAVSTAHDVACSRASATTTTVNLLWHPLVDQRAATSNDDTACNWDPFGYNGLSVDPFQFSADDLLTRMLADVPAPKRRQRMRKGSTTSPAHPPCMLSNPLSLTAHEDSRSTVQPSSAPYSVHYGTAFGIPSDGQSHSVQKTRDRAANGSSQQLSLPYSTQLNDFYSVRADNHGMSSVGCHPLYNHPQQSMSSVASVPPFSLDSRMTVSNHAAIDSRSEHTDQHLPVKRRHVKPWNSPGSRSSAGAFCAVTEMTQQSPFRDIHSEGAFVENDVSKDHANTAKLTETHLSTPVSRYGACSPRALWSDAQRVNSSISAGYPAVDAYRFRLPYQQSCSWSHSSSSYVFNDVPYTSTLPFVPDSRKPSSVGGGLTARPSFTTSSNHSLHTANEASSGAAWRPYHPQTFSAVDLQNGGVCDQLSGTANYTLAATAACMSTAVDQPHVSSIGSRPPPASAHIGVVSETCSTVDYCGISATSVPPPSVVQSASPRDGWAGSDSDYGSASVTDSGIASNTSLSVGSDHSENDRGSVEMNAADPIVSAKLSPVSTSDRVCAPSSPLPGSSTTDCLSAEPLLDGVVTSGCAVMRMTPVSAGQNGESCVTACGKHSGKPPNWIGDGSHTDSKKSGQAGSVVRNRFARRSRQTSALVGECPPAITCPSLPRRLSESVKRAMRGGAATDPPMTSAPCDIGPTKVVIRITKTQCGGSGEAKRSKQKEQWCVQPIVKPFQSPTHISADVAGTVNGTLHCSAASSNNTVDSDVDGVPAVNPFEKSVRRKELDVTLHGVIERRGACSSSNFSGRLTDAVTQPMDGAMPAVQNSQADVDKVHCSDDDMAVSTAVHHENSSESAAVLQSFT